MFSLGYALAWELLVEGGMSPIKKTKKSLFEHPLTVTAMALHLLLDRTTFTRGHAPDRARLLALARRLSLRAGAILCASTDRKGALIGQMQEWLGSLAVGLATSIAGKWIARDRGRELAKLVTELEGHAAKVLADRDHRAKTPTKSPRKAPAPELPATADEALLRDGHRAEPETAVAVSASLTASGSVGSDVSQACDESYGDPDHESDQDAEGDCLATPLPHGDMIADGGDRIVSAVSRGGESLRNSE